jgi:hypothetical protein
MSEIGRSKSGIVTYSTDLVEIIDFSKKNRGLATLHLNISGFQQ